MNEEDDETKTEQEEANPQTLPPTVRALGVVSLCTDLSSEMVYPINPIFLRRVLGAPPEVLGLIEGVAEATASVLKLYSGALSDRMGRRKPLTVWGYSLAAFSKPLIGLAPVWGWVFAARLLDRTGKGIRSAPRDALIADSVPPALRGRAFGLHRSMDTTGAVLGPLLGWLFLSRFPDRLRLLYFLAFIPAALGVLALALFVRERPRGARPDLSRPLPPTPSPKGKGEPEGRAARVPAQPLSPPSLPKGLLGKGEGGIGTPRFAFFGLSASYRRYLLLVGLFGLGNSSDTFLLLRAQSMGVSPQNLLLLYALFNGVEASLAWIAGSLSDRVGRRPLIALGWLVFALVYGGFAVLPERGVGSWAAWALFAVYGLYSTLTGGTQKALAADLAHPARRGAEIGAFHLLVGLAALPASLLAGFLYAHVSPSAPFYFSASVAALSGLLLLLSPSKTEAGS